MKREIERPRTYVHTYAMVLMGEQGKSQTSLAAAAGVSLAMVNAVLLGKRTSAAVQQVIAEELGFMDWAHLEDTSFQFSNLFSVMLNRPTERPRQEAADVDPSQDVI